MKKNKDAPIANRAQNNSLSPSKRALAPAQIQVATSELDELFVRAQLKRSHSDTTRSKDELMSKRVILRELQEMKECMIYQQDEGKSEIDIGFLHASPIFLVGADS